MNAAFTRANLEVEGFEGFVPVSALGRSRATIPLDSGIYVVYRASLVSPAFLQRSVGGWFKGRDPSVSRGRLTSEWVNDCSTLYIGRATSLNERIGQLVRFANGDRVGHWGGRLLWQLADHSDFLVGWRIEDDPVSAEAALIADFAELFGVLPFANLQRPRVAVGV